VLQLCDIVTYLYNTDSIRATRNTDSECYSCVTIPENTCALPILHDNLREGRSANQKKHIDQPDEDEQNVVRCTQKVQYTKIQCTERQGIHKRPCRSRPNIQRTVHKEPDAHKVKPNIHIQIYGDCIDL